jgi:tetratricopeptide (TPR) repeat protein
MPRSRIALESAIAAARSCGDRAQAHYELALFHDNNSRESEAVPHYETALKLGLVGEQKAQALAWLASSLYKTGLPDDASKRAQQARRLTADPTLIRFLEKLTYRIANVSNKSFRGLKRAPIGETKPVQRSARILGKARRIQPAR